MGSLCALSLSKCSRRSTARSEGGCGTSSTKRKPKVDKGGRRRSHPHDATQKEDITYTGLIRELIRDSEEASSPPDQRRDRAAPSCTGLHQ
jgi:hypothetical protein